jgi:hypothetical protein
MAIGGIVESAVGFVTGDGAPVALIAMLLVVGHYSKELGDSAQYLRLIGMGLMVLAFLVMTGVIEGVDLDPILSLFDWIVSTVLGPS